MRSNIKKVFWFYFLLFFILIVYLLFFTFFKSDTIIGNPYNPRVKASQNNNIKRGAILDKSFNIIAQTKESRVYNYDDVFAHIVGFISNGGYGIESKYNFELQTLNNSLLQQLNLQINKNKVLQGNSIVLTIDKDLQQYCYDKLKNKKGAIVVMDSTTGKILAMVSSPSFNPNNVSKNWDTIISDTENNPLVNRATQGLYPPASVFKIITAATFIENYNDWEDYTYTCKGYETYEDIKIDCFDKKAHKEINLEQALAVSCNSFFVNLSSIITPEQLSNVANRALFNKPLGFPLDYNKSSFSLDINSPIDEIMQTYIGQGKTLTTPLHIALIGCGVANNGLIMSPYIVDSTLDYKGKTITKNMPKNLTTAFSIDTAQTIKNMLKKVVTNGTGVKAQIKNISISAKTGTAQIDNEKDHTWFLGIAPTENPNIVVSIIFENSGSHSNIVETARDIISFCKPMLNKIEK
ncbi:penicillin-binding transpeptidase domain-containing protein [uncultured Tyzzerella sp.]|uniref:peptidoglycan D,D-transpeptidase FtsI family protein n=1 Tax=uncultured Tyzzerella sp. TaxID=2321398 RepID=UPI002943EB9C|nr:penicillin-binding transpeptidase domain-containing protein [uncultured Tyzzerella sp.]